MRSGRLRLVLLGLAALTTLGLLQFTHYYLNVFATGRSEPFTIKLIEEMTAAYGAVLLAPLAWLARRAERRGWPAGRLLALHAAMLSVFSALHTTWNWATRSAIFPLVGRGAYDYGRMPLRYLMELPSDVLFYALIMGLVHLFWRYRDSRDREVRVAQLEAELGNARLEALEGQLRPHFLFNALNTISSVMYEDLGAADTMLARLADLLRQTLRRPAGAEIPLAEELETLELYLAIMRARFAERLTADVEIEAGTAAALVPPLLLQPLVENAIVHGTPPDGMPARIVVRARREHDRLVVAVEDEGPGIATGAAPRHGHGIGLSATVRRLEQLHGDRASLTLRNRTDGGVRTEVSLPFRVQA